MTIEQLKKRKHLLDSLLILMILVGISVFVIGIFVQWLMIILALILLLAIPIQKAYQKLNLEFKKVHVKQMIESIIPGLIFIPEKGFDADFVFQSEVLKKYTRFKSEDYLSGTLNGKNFESADVLITQVVSTGKSSTEITRFLGRLFVVDFNKKFEHDVYLSTDGNHTPGNKHNLLKIKTESIEFNKKFKIYSESEHSAFYLLTPKFMEHIDRFSDIAKHVMLAFKKDKIFIAVYTERDAFNLKFWDTIDDNYIENVKIELKLLEDLIEFVPK